MGTFIVSAGLIIIVALIIRSMIKNRKKGCGCGCSGCGMAESCHSKK